jgi:hypothetical protein
VNLREPVLNARSVAVAVAARCMLAARVRPEWKGLSVIPNGGAGRIVDDGVGAPNDCDVRATNNRA